MKENDLDDTVAKAKRIVGKNNTDLVLTLSLELLASEKENEKKLELLAKEKENEKKLTEAYFEKEVYHVFSEVLWINERRICVGSVGEQLPFD